MTRRIRSFAAIFAVIGLLFAQLAVAAYSCPGVSGAVSEYLSPLTRECCDEPTLNVDLKALCHAHCHQGDQALEKPSVSFPDQAPTSAPVPGVSGHLHHAIAIAAPGEQRSLLARATAPPVALRHCCLRL